VLTREKDLDVMEVQVEVTPEVFTDTVGALEQLQGRLSRSIESMVGVRANIRLVQPRTIARSEGKAKRVIDQRKM
jgi:phenylacetate-CoA ligase